MWRHPYSHKIATLMLPLLLYYIKKIELCQILNHERARTSKQN